MSWHFVQRSENSFHFFAQHLSLKLEHVDKILRKSFYGKFFHFRNPNKICAECKTSPSDVKSPLSFELSEAYLVQVPILGEKSDKETFCGNLR